jgi:PAS domain S-box-containing protein
MASPDGRALYVNRAGRRLVAIAEDDDVSQLSIPDFHPRWASELVLAQALPTAVREGSWRGETALLTKDGREIPVVQSVAAHRDASGAVELFSMIMHDITDRKRAEEALRDSERRFRLHVDGAPEAIVVLDLEQGRFVDWNANALALFACSAEDLARQSPATLSPMFQPDGRPSRDAAMHYIGRALAGERRPRRRLRMRRECGSLRAGMARRLLP